MSEHKSMPRKGVKWTLFTDGSAPRNTKYGGPTGIGAALFREGIEVASLAAFTGKGTVNTAEFNAIWMGIRMAMPYILPEDCLEIRSDSQIAIRTITGEYRNNHFKVVVADIQAELEHLFGVTYLTNVTFTHISRNFNTIADELSGKYTRK